jgi:hypothetical protein
MRPRLPPSRGLWRPDEGCGRSRGTLKLVSALFCVLRTNWQHEVLTGKPLQQTDSRCTWAVTTTDPGTTGGAFAGSGHLFASVHPVGLGRHFLAAVPQPPMLVRLANQASEWTTRRRALDQRHHRSVVSLTSFGAFESAESSSGHFRSDNEVGWGGGGQSARRASLRYFSAIHAKLCAVPASLGGAPERLARSASRRISVAGPAAVG